MVQKIPSSEVFVPLPFVAVSNLLLQKGIKAKGYVI